MLELTAGDARAVIDPARGGRVASLRLGERELLVPSPDPHDLSMRWGLFLMAPWPGRLAGGRLRFLGRTYQLRRTHGRHAIHGLLWSAPWAVARSSATESELRVGLDREGWPFGGEVRHAIRLEPGALTLEASILADRAMPAAVGWHPWFQRGSPDPSLRLPADGILERRSMLPTGAVLPLAGRTDLRGGPILGRRRLDDAYVGARSPAVLRWPDLELRLSFGPDCETVVVYTPWNAVCIEPQTARPNALGLRDAAGRAAGRRDIEPGETLATSMRIAWEAGGG
jgi:aldose 1-epimerase